MHLMRSSKWGWGREKQASPRAPGCPRRASDPAWSPDGTQIAYLVGDKTANCQHVDVVKADGSEAMAPRRVRDCTKAKGFLTQLAWVRKN